MGLIYWLLVSYCIDKTRCGVNSMKRRVVLRRYLCKMNGLMLECVSVDETIDDSSSLARRLCWFMGSPKMSVALGRCSVTQPIDCSRPLGIDTTRYVSDFILFVRCMPNFGRVVLRSFISESTLWCWSSMLAYLLMASQGWH